MNDEPTKIGTRPPQFSLRVLFLLTAMVAVLALMAVEWGIEPIAASMVIVGLIAIFVFLYAVLFKWRDILFVAAIVAIVLLLVFSGPLLTTDVNSETSRRLKCMDNLRQINLALHAYYQDYGSFPPAYIADEEGNPMHSWRVLLLPYLEEKILYAEYRFDEPWDGPNNSKLHATVPRVLLCPSDPTMSETSTSYVAVVGPGTMWPGVRPTRLGEVKDDPYLTLMLVEISDSGIHWMEPRDLDVKQLAETLRGPSNHPGGRCVLFVSGMRFFIDNQTAAAKLEAMATIAGGEKIEISE